MADGNSLSRFIQTHWTATGFAAGFVLSTVAFLGYSGRNSAAQPIAFNHSKHIANGLACADCHTGVETQARATLPSLDTCMNCHATAQTKSAEEQKIRALAAAGKEPAWTQLTRMPAHVYFSHRRHVVLAKLSCAVCHGAMEKAVAPPTKPFREFTMTACLECHENKRGGTDCNDCHR